MVNSTMDPSDHRLSKFHLLQTITKYYNETKFWKERVNKLNKDLRETRKLNLKLHEENKTLRELQEQGERLRVLQQKNEEAQTAINVAINNW